MLPVNPPAAPKKKSFWKTTTGIITKITAFITAVTALVIAIKSFNKNVLPAKKEPQVTTPNNPPNSDGGTGKKPDTPPVEAKPNIAIGAFSISPTEIELDEDAKPRSIQAQVEAINEGDATAKGCAFVIETDNGTLGNATSPSFSLAPKERKSFAINFSISTTGNLKARLISYDGTVKESAPVYINVYQHGTIHHVKPLN